MKKLPLSIKAIKAGGVRYMGQYCFIKMLSGVLSDSLVAWRSLSQFPHMEIKAAQSFSDIPTRWNLHRESVGLSHSTILNRINSRMALRGASSLGRSECSNSLSRKNSEG